jgi:hypothetical protein
MLFKRKIKSIIENGIPKPTNPSLKELGNFFNSKMNKMVDIVLTVPMPLNMTRGNNCKIALLKSIEI